MKEQLGPDGISLDCFSEDLYSEIGHCREEEAPVFSYTGQASEVPFRGKRQLTAIIGRKTSDHCLQIVAICRFYHRLEDFFRSQILFVLFRHKYPLFRSLLLSSYSKVK